MMRTQSELLMGFYAHYLQEKSKYIASTSSTFNCQLELELYYGRLIIISMDDNCIRYIKVLIKLVIW